MTTIRTVLLTLWKKVRSVRLTLGKKLFSGFLIVIILTSAVGAIGINNMQQMQNKTTEISGQWLPGVESINNISFLAERAHSLHILQLQVADPSAKQSAATQALAAVNNVDEQLKVYSAMIRDEQEQRNYDAFKAQWDKYKSFQPAFAALSADVDLLKGSGAKSAEVTKLLTESEKVFNGLHTYLDALVKIKHEGAVQASADSAAIFVSVRSLMLYGLLASAAAGLLLSLFITRSIARPVRIVRRALLEIATGRLHETDIVVKSNDEIGELVSSLNRMKANLRQMLSGIQQAAATVTASSDALFASSAETSQASYQVAEEMQKLAAGADTQVRISSETNEAMEQMSSGVQRIAETSSDVSEVSQIAYREARQGEVSLLTLADHMTDMSGVVQRTDDTIRKLEAESQEIEQIVQFIREIASQTSLLSLNASIEAARAGELGRGFAVVAGEVKKLSEQSAEASERIATRIAKMKKNTLSAVTSMDECLLGVMRNKEVVQAARESFQRIVASVEQVSDKIQEVAAAAQQMAAGTEEIAASAADNSSVARSSALYAQNAAETAQQQLLSIEQIAAAAATLKDTAHQLAEEAKKFDL
ncbi:methyl-accepting chemotaxis protein [Paenibacillus chartarius]|uniref:Methyl-accepting chemotaxis protein n=1 Tax=Paenibacillus chartarius TaxID=747481 RepID=A0ABV6DS98_9BACL